MRIRRRAEPIVLVQLFLLGVTLSAHALGGLSGAPMVLLYLSAILVTALYALRHVSLPSLYHLFALSYILLFLLHPVAAPFLSITMPERWVLRIYTTLSVGGLLLLNIAYELAGSRNSESSPDKYAIALPRLERSIWLLLALYLWSLLLIVLDAGSLGAVLRASRVDRLEQGGPATLAAIYLITFTSGLFALFPAYAARRRAVAVPIWLVLAIAEAFVFAAFRLRTFLLMHLGAVAIGYVIIRPRVEFPDRRIEIRKAKKNRVLAISVVVAAVLVVAPYVRFARGLLEQGGRSALSDIKLLEVLRLNMVTGDLGYAPIVYDVIRYVPAHHRFLLGQSYFRVLFTPVPRSVWPSKPPNTERLVASWLEPDLPEMTLPPGVQGDLYINFGIFGLLGFAVWGALLARFDRIVGLRRHLLAATSVTIVFHFVRGGFTNSVLLFITLLILTRQLAKYLEGRPSPRESLVPGPLEGVPPLAL